MSSTEKSSIMLIASFIIAAVVTGGCAALCLGEDGGRHNPPGTVDLPPFLL